jgi:membrane protein
MTKDATSEPGSKRPVRQWLASRPYELAPWIVLLALAPFAFRPKTVVEPHEPPPGLSEDRILPPDDFDAAEPMRGRAAKHPRHIPAARLARRHVAGVAARWVRTAARRWPAASPSMACWPSSRASPPSSRSTACSPISAWCRRQLAEMSGVFPASVVQVVGDQMLRLTSQEQTKLSFAFVVSVLISVWSARAGMGALFDGLNVAYDETEKRHFAVKTALTYGFTFWPGCCSSPASRRCWSACPMC